MVFRSRDLNNLETRKLSFVLLGYFLHVVSRLYLEYIDAASNLARKVWTKFDDSLIFWGLLLGFLSCAAISLHLFSLSENGLEENDQYLLTLFSLRGVMLALIFSKSGWVLPFSIAAPSDDYLSFRFLLHVICWICLLACLELLYQSFVKISKRVLIEKRITWASLAFLGLSFNLNSWVEKPLGVSQVITCGAAENLISSVGLIFFLGSHFSNSYIIFEPFVSNFICSTILILRISLKEMTYHYIKNSKLASKDRMISPSFIFAFVLGFTRFIGSGDIRVAEDASKMLSISILETFLFICCILFLIFLSFLVYFFMQSRISHDAHGISFYGPFFHSVLLNSFFGINTIAYLLVSLYLFARCTDYILHFSLFINIWLPRVVYLSSILCLSICFFLPRYSFIFCFFP